MRHGISKAALPLRTIWNVSPTKHAMRYLRISLAVLLVVIVLLVYHESPSNGFHFDDEVNITRQSAIRIQELTLDAFTNVLVNVQLSRRPLPNITFALDWWRGGGNPAAFQWTNLVIHCLVVLAVFMLFLTVAGTDSRGHLVFARLLAAFLAAAVWAVHPIQVQAVTYIVQRMTSLAALFTVLTVVAYIGARRSDQTSRRVICYSVMAVCAWFAVLSKENAYIIPILIIMTEFAVVRYGRPLFTRPWEVLLACTPLMLGVYVAVDVASSIGPVADRVLPGYAGREFSLSERLLTQPRVVFFYISQILWPVPYRFSIEHDFLVSRSLVDPPTTLFAIAGIAAWVGGSIYLILKRPFRLYGYFLLWVPVTLAIESSIIPLEMVFEHRMYIPSIGLAGVLVLAIGRWMERSELSMYLASAGIAASVVFVSWSTMSIVPNWRSSVTLYEAAARNAPHSARAWANLGIHHLKSGNAAPAMQALQGALKIDAGHVKALEAMGVLLMDSGRLEEAETMFHRVALLSQATPSLLNHMGELALKRGNYGAAEKYFREAIRLAGWNPVYYWNLALVYERQGNCQAALVSWRRYLSLSVSSEKRRMVESQVQEDYLRPGGKCYRGVN